MLIELDVFSYALTTAVHLYASVALALTLAAAALWATRQAPSEQRELSPAMHAVRSR